MTTSFEIVPRNEQSVQDQLTFIDTHLPFIDTINIPDLLRMPIRSWDAGAFVNRGRYRFIPHFRAIDFNLHESVLQKIIEKHRFDRVLLVSGDPPPSMAHRVYDTNVIDLIEKIRGDFPDLTIYAGFDPYRSSINDERQYMLRKLEAGADYLLSQPFFDMRLLEIFSELVPQGQLFWGVSPVTTEKSQWYWQKVNHAVFPQHFQASYEWNIQFALDVLRHCAANQSHVYFMPISIKLENYFLPIAQAYRPMSAN